MAPAVDVILLTFNGLRDTRECVMALYEAENSSFFHLICVDQGSTDGTVAYLDGLASERSNVTFFRSDANLGFGGGCNKGCSLGNSPNILLLNNDALLPRHGLRRLLSAMEQNQMDAVGPISNETGEIQKYWGPYQVTKYRSEMRRVDEKLERGYGEKVAVFHRLAGFCLLVKRSAFESVSGFSDHYGVGYYEDDDLSYRLRLAGFKLAVAPGVFVHHHGSRSFKKAGISSSSLIVRNRLVFLRETYFSSILGNDYNYPLSSVSVIIATKDRPDLLKNAIRSVLQQTFLNFEVIVVNDGGSSLVEVVGSFSDQRIRLLELSENKGKSHALNYAVERATSDFIAYLDDDDLYLPHHLRVLMNAINIAQTDFVYADSEARVIRVDGSVDSSYLTDIDFDITRIEYSNFVPNLSILHRNNPKYRHEETLRTIEDWDFLRRAAMEWGAEFVHVPILTTIFHVREDARSRNGARYRDPATYFDALADIRTRGGWWLPGVETSETVRVDSQERPRDERLGLLRYAVSKNPWNSLAQRDLMAEFKECRDRSELASVSTKYIAGFPSNFPTLQLEIKLLIGQGDAARLRSLCELALLFAPGPTEASWVYRVLSRAYVGECAMTSELCYKRSAWLVELQYYEGELVSPWARRRAKAVNKYRQEGLVGVVRAIWKRIPVFLRLR